MTVRPLRAPCLALLIASLPACTGSNKSTVSGKISYKGTPLNSGEIRFKVAGGTDVFGEIKSDGTYSIADVPRGTHQVQIFSIDDKAANAYFVAMAGRNPDGGPPIGPDGKPVPKGGKPLEMTAFSKIPAKYSKYDTSGLTIEVKDSSVKKDFELTD